MLRPSFLLLFVITLLVLQYLGLTTAQPLYKSCGNSVNYTKNSTFETNLNTLLPLLASNTSASSGYSNRSVGRGPEVVYGLVLCRGDVNPSSCGTCLQTATQGIKQECPYSKGAAIWYEYCQLRYSYTNFFSLMEDAGKIQLVNTQDMSNPNEFAPLVKDLLTNLSKRAASDASLRMFAAGKARMKGGQDVYGMVQCTRDLAGPDCLRCLQGAIGDIDSTRRGARILSTSCNIRFEVYSFINEDALTPSAPTFPLPPSPNTNSTGTGSKGSSTRTLLLAILIPIAVVLILTTLIFICIIKKKPKKKYHVVTEENEISTVESLQFSLDAIKAATNDFSDENKLGQGGFGAVYKGVYHNGQEIAVKRLSSSSGQGVEEFKNEVLLVAKLQHRNLVRLLGCCVEDNEKLLIYEFVPKTSLDHFLFDPIKKLSLTWERRYKIIGGIARGLLYLHEDSRLRIIHRDLKASNILLDNDMSPKISDFGMARLVGVDQTQGNTNRIAGTYGYMAPEYAMHGQFSVKSDVFSFGVLLLEIVSGQKNNSSCESENATDLLSSAWKLWKDGAALEIIDEALSGSYVRSEVMRCIHIGFLCVQEDPSQRPTMSSVGLMLNSFSITLQAPSPPAFFLGSQREFSKNVLLSNSTSGSLPVSINEVTISEMDPR